MKQSVCYRVENHSSVTHTLFGLQHSNLFDGKNLDDVSEIGIMLFPVTVWEGPSGEDGSGPQAIEGTSFTILDNCDTSINNNAFSQNIAINSENMIKHT